MAQKLSDSIVKALLAPAAGNQITYDTDIRGFGCRVTAKGVRSFVLNYRTHSGLERRYTIGQFPAWKATAARAEAAELKKRVDRGGDPLAELKEKRDAPTVADLCTRYEAEHLPKKRESSRASDRSMIERHVLPALRNKKVGEITFTEIDSLHRKITAAGTPYRANRVMALLSKMFGLAIKWGWRKDNPAKGIERNQEVKRERYIAGTELERLVKAIAEFPDRQAANIIRLLLLTGARSGEVRAARWEQFDLTRRCVDEARAPPPSKRLSTASPCRPRPASFCQSSTPTQKTARSLYFPARHDGHRGNLKREWA